LAQLTADSIDCLARRDALKDTLVPNVMLAAERKVHGVTVESGGNIQSTGQFAVLGIGIQLPVRAAGIGGDRYALARLDKGGVALAGMDLPHARVTGRVVVDDPQRGSGMIWTVDRVRAALVGGDADQQAARRGVQLFDKFAQLTHFFRCAGDDELIAVSGDAAFPVQDGLCRWKKVFSKTVLER